MGSSGEGEIVRHPIHPRTRLMLSAAVVGVTFSFSPSVQLARGGDDLGPVRTAPAPNAPALPVPQPTDEVIVFLKNGTDSSELARQFGASVSQTLGDDAQAVVLKAS